MGWLRGIAILEELLMDFVPLLVVTSMIKKIVDFFKYAANGDINAVVTQLVSWVTGIAAAFAVSGSDWGNTIAVNGTLLSHLNSWAIALFGINRASTAGVGWDFIKAVDTSNSAVTPNLLGASLVRQGVPGSSAPVVNNVDRVT
jgi:hypothetical protein